MEHPLIGSLDSLSIEDLAAKISELNKKLGIATRMGNPDLTRQIRMALENHQIKYQEKAAEMMKRQSGDRGTNFDDIIDIS